ncbi:hypothetical protein [Gloeobacter kilaueensis]|uniref:Uncharacterized protein n=1 Tax=Gloeobacter kilaueensis (strain ATCC BAA-2537 / CCAP 1431/1 / ULC 316 / JS1) TaxID=1183438 RepID=U5QHI2_GLOK1|nr:hypothetical protein [Gloeobacter kilaueensis]AGY58427.1 hypothetical protein GKIL_2181 [Gloeobacter kilaueensis JS1]
MRQYTVSTANRRVFQLSGAFVACLLVASTAAMLRGEFSRQIPAPAILPAVVPTPVQIKTPFPAIDEQVFVRQHERQLAAVPETIVTPDCTLTRYQLADWYYLFSGGRLALMSKNPTNRVHQYCPAPIQ